MLTIRGEFSFKTHELLNGSLNRTVRDIQSGITTITRLLSFERNLFQRTVLQINNETSFHATLENFCFDGVAIDLLCFI